MSLDADWRARLLVEYSTDRFACEVLDGQVTGDKYRVVDEIIYYRDQIFLTKGLSSRRRYFRRHMIHHWQVIRGLPKPIGPLERGSHGRASRRTYSSMSGSAMFAKGTRRR